MSSYKPAGDGTFTRIRTIREWAVETDGKETVFDRKKHALLVAVVLKSRGQAVRLIEVTTLRTRGPATINCRKEFHDEIIQTDISNQIPAKYER